jgi:hypothetical protein
MPSPCFHCRIAPTVKSRTSPPPRFQECAESCPLTPLLQSQPPANPYQLSSSNPGRHASPRFLTLLSFPPIPTAISARRQHLPKSSSNLVRPICYMPCAASPPVLQFSPAANAYQNRPLFQIRHVHGCGGARHRPWPHRLAPIYLPNFSMNMISAANLAPTPRPPSTSLDGVPSWN